jgi:hypothetical protein
VGGICFPLMVVVALGEPSSPYTCCARTVGEPAAPSVLESRTCAVKSELARRRSIGA